MTQPVKVTVTVDERLYTAETDGEPRGRVMVYSGGKFIGGGRWTGRMLDNTDGNIDEDVLDRLDEALIKALRR